MTTVQDVLDPKEKIVWQGKPKFWPFIWPSFFAILFGLFFMAIPLFIFAVDGDVFILLFPHFWIGLAIAIGAPLYAILVHKHVEYVITEKRVLIKKGLIGRDFDSIDFEKIQDVSVNVGLVDKIFGTGTIVATSAGALQFPQGRGMIRGMPGSLFKSIEKPYDVYKLLKTVAFDVKTDINYPNKYRPRTNPGYPTSYKPRTVRGAKRIKVRSQKAR